MRVVLTARQSLTSYETVLNHLVFILGEISKNPSNPKFNHYTFESISAIVRCGSSDHLKTTKGLTPRTTAVQIPLRCESSGAHQDRGRTLPPFHRDPDLGHPRYAHNTPSASSTLMFFLPQSSRHSSSRSSPSYSSYTLSREARFPIPMPACSRLFSCPSFGSRGAMCRLLFDYCAPFSLPTRPRSLPTTAYRRCSVFSRS